MKAIVIHQYGDRSVFSLEQIATPTPSTSNRERLDELADLF